MSDSNQTGTQRLSARIRAHADNGEYKQARIATIGPMGIEMIVNHETMFSVLQRVSIEILSEGEASVFDGFVIGAKKEEDPKNTVRLSVRFLLHPAPKNDRRSDTRWLCPSAFLPVAMAPTPGKFNDFTIFQIRNISKQGFELRTGSLNQDLVRGMILRLSISLPLIGETNAVVKILRIDAVALAGREILVAGVEFVNVDNQARELISQYLFQFSNIDSFSEVSSAWPASSAKSKALGLSFLRSIEDYESLSHMRAKQASTQIDSADLRPDLYSRIVTAKKDDQLEAALRVTLPDILNDTNVRKPIWPSELPRRDQIVEVSDFIVRTGSTPDRKLRSMLSYVASTCLSGQRPYLVAHLSSEYDSLMLRAGFDRVVTSENSIVFVGHPIKAVTGRGTSVSDLNLIWKSAANYMISSKTVVPKGVTRIMVKIYALLGRLASTTD